MVVTGIRSSRLQLGAGNTETFTPSSAAGINPSCGLQKPGDDDDDDDEVMLNVLRCQLTY